MHRPRIVIIGSGNVAWHLTPALAEVGDVVEVCSRNIVNAQALCVAKVPNAKASDNFSEVVDDADFYIIAVADDSVSEIAKAFPPVKGIVAHTSGSIPLEALEPNRHRGVFYPLQTFSKDANINISEVPFLIEGSDEETTEALCELALKLSQTVVRADSELRRRIHVAAVFTCNFPNYLWGLASRLLKEDGLDLSLMRPLLYATLDKALALGPENAQTGPARRGDKHVIDSHIASLPADEAEIYRLLSNRIYKTYNKE